MKYPPDLFCKFSKRYTRSAQVTMFPSEPADKGKSGRGADPIPLLRQAFCGNMSTGDREKDIPLSSKRGVRWRTTGRVDESPGVRQPSLSRYAAKPPKLSL